MAFAKACLALAIVFIIGASASAQNFSLERPNRRPRVAIVIDHHGDRTKGDAKLLFWKDNLINATEAHLNVGQDVTIYYRVDANSQDYDDLRQAVENLRVKWQPAMPPRKTKAGAELATGNLTAIPFGTAMEGEGALREWFMEQFVLSNAAKNSWPIPFGYLLAIGHGEMTLAGDRCLKCDDEVVNLSNLERLCDNCYLPMICVYDICTVRGGRAGGINPAGISVQHLEISPTPTNADILKFVQEGRSKGGAFVIQTSVVTRFASVGPDGQAIDDGKFFAAYASAFERTKKKPLRFERLSGEPKQRQHMLKLEQLVDAFREKSAEAQNADLYKSWAISPTGGAMTRNHVIAALAPNFAYAAPPLEMSNSFNPATAPPLNHAMTFQADKQGDFVMIDGIGPPNGNLKPYAAINCADFFKPTDPNDAPIATLGKTLYVGLTTNRPMLLGFSRNRLQSIPDANQPDVEFLNCFRLNPGSSPTYQAVPDLDFMRAQFLAENNKALPPASKQHLFNASGTAYLEGLGSRASERGISLAPVAGNYGEFSPNDYGLKNGDKLIIGPLLLADLGNEQATLNEWLAWKSATELALNELWVPQRWWRSDPNGKLTYAPSATAPSLIAQKCSFMGMGGPIAFARKIYPPANRLKIEMQMELGFAGSLVGSPEAISVLAFSGENVLVNERIDTSGKDGKRLTQTVFLSANETVDYLSIVLHGEGSVRITKMTLSPAK